MNDDLPASFARPPSPTLPSSSQSASEEQRNVRGRREAQLADRRNKNRKVFSKKRGELLDDLLYNLDVLIYAELSTVYYMDCSFIRFALRAICQFVFLTPKPAFFPETPPNRPYIGAIFGSNLICILFHLLSSAPTAGEATRGYMHGGLAIDFIGQKGPSSKIHLLLLDLLLLFLQVLCLSSHITRQNLKDVSQGNTARGSRSLGRAQDVDHEERGLHRADTATPETIELQNLNPSGSTLAPPAASASASTTANDYADEDSAPRRTDAHIFDAFNSGQIVLVDLDPIKTVREQFWEYQNARPSENRDSRQTMRENIMGQLLRSRLPTARRTTGRVLGE